MREMVDSCFRGNDRETSARVRVQNLRKLAHHEKFSIGCLHASNRSFAFIVT
jgi:hypothetical protein